MIAVAGVPVSNPQRIVFPHDELTKLDVARWYARVAPVMLPHVAGRPLAFVRCPDGVAGSCFFQKHWSGRLPSVLNRVAIRQADGRRRDYVVVRDVAGLVTLAQWGIIEVHAWGSRAATLESPDRIVFDLDPGPGTSWVAVRGAALAVRQLLSAIGLTCWVKTTGGKGLHVVVPLSRRTGWPEASAFARGVAERIAAAAPDRYLTDASKAARHGKVFIDWLRNTRGATSVAPWSLRARAEAGVSVPIPWSRLPGTTAGDEWRLPFLLRGRLPAGPSKALLASKQTLTRPMLDAALAIGRPRPGATPRRRRRVPSRTAGSTG